MARRGSLSAGIRESLDDEPALAAEPVDVAVSDNDVLIRGSVDWRYERDGIEHLVERVAGVRVLQDDISVKPASEAHDSIVAAVASAAVEADPGAMPDIRVETHGDGTLTLLGRVRTEPAYRAALAAAWAVPGVQNVRDELSFEF